MKLTAGNSHPLVDPSPYAIAGVLRALQGGVNSFVVLDAGEEEEGTFVQVAGGGRSPLVLEICLGNYRPLLRCTEPNLTVELVVDVFVDFSQGGLAFLDTFHWESVRAPSDLAASNVGIVTTAVAPVGARKQSEPGSFCPYCGYELWPPPIHTRRCRRCGNMIYFRPHSFYDSVYVTGVQASSLSELETLQNWIRIHSIKAPPLDDFVGSLYDAYSNNRSLDEAVCDCYEQVIAVADGRVQVRLLENVASFRQGRGLDFNGVLSAARDKELALLIEEATAARSDPCANFLDYPGKQVFLVSIWNKQFSCEPCREQADTMLWSVEEALECKPLPHRGCLGPGGFCRCRYDKTYSTVLRSRWS